MLNINAFESNEHLGDKTYLYIQPSQPGAKLKLGKDFNPHDDSFFTLITIEDGSKVFKVDLEKLSSVSKQPYGNLSDLFLTMDSSELELVPRDLISDRTSGTRISLWTETIVRGDKSSIYGNALSNKSDIWIPIINSKPVLDLPNNFVIDEEKYNLNQPIIDATILDLTSTLNESDLNDLHSWEVDIPSELNDYIYFDNDSLLIRISPNVKSLYDLPSGKFNLVIRVKI